MLAISSTDSDYDISGSRSGKQIEIILSRFDKNIVYHLRDLRKVTWNLVFYLKSVQTRSKHSLHKFNEYGDQTVMEKIYAINHIMK